MTSSRETASLGIAVGGWFMFEKKRRWAYRSNACKGDEGIRQRAARATTRRSARVLGERGITAPVRTIAERVRTIWRSG